MSRIRRIIYEVRWWKWYLSTGNWPMRTLYMGPYRLDKSSRRIIIDRINQKALETEPMFDGGYPHRRDGKS